MDVVVLETWGIIDMWWTDNSIKVDYAVVCFLGRKITFKRIQEDLVWRIIENE